MKILNIELDKADRAILKLLQQDATTSINTLSDACSMSTASIQRRLKRLKEQGVIAKEVAVLDSTKLGQTMTFVVMVELERERMDQLNEFRKVAIKEPHVQQCYYVTGDADFVLICICSDMQAFESLTHRLFFENQNVRRFRTSVVMGLTKVGLEIPI